ncbi:hypothetical protein LINPERHAP1_LOCUS37862 [Linum perenne]
MVGEIRRNMAHDMEELRVDCDILPVIMKRMRQHGHSVDFFVEMLLLTNCNFNFNVFKNHIASIWKSRCGLPIQDLGKNRMLFWFFHQKDLRWVPNSGP